MLDLTPNTGDYVLGGQNTLLFTLTGPNFEAITENSAWGAGAYARVTLELL